MLGSQTIQVAERIIVHCPERSCNGRIVLYSCQRDGSRRLERHLLCSLCRREPEKLKMAIR